MDLDQMALSEAILGNPGVTHSIPTAFVMNAVGMEWVTPGLQKGVRNHLIWIYFFFQKRINPGSAGEELIGIKLNF